jgi:hypothetical protein
MQQRQLRLGDTLDDYCPRERRLANHTIVAMVGDEIRLTRCTTCDTEHVYKGGKAPRLRKKPTSVEAAYSEVLESVTHDMRTPAAAPASDSPAANDGARGDGSASEAGQMNADDAVPASSNGSGAPMPPEEVRLHRPLIRAQLPRIEREPLPRAIPEFTVRQASKRQGRFQNSRPPGRFAKSGGAGGGGNNRPGNSRGPGGPQHGMRPGGRPPGHGGRPPQHSGKKRSR